MVLSAGESDNLRGRQNLSGFGASLCAEKNPYRFNGNHAFLNQPLIDLRRFEPASTIVSMLVSMLAPAGSFDNFCGRESLPESFWPF